MTTLLYRSPDSSAEVWLGDCLDPESVAAIMGERKADALIVDAPYSERTHNGHNGASRRDPSKMRNPEKIPRAVVYECWTAGDVASFCSLWSPLTRGWVVTITDHILAPEWEHNLNGRYVFSPLPLVEMGGRIRLTGDGPTCWACWIVAARPSSYSRWGALPGAYVLGRETKDVVGGKPLAGMLAIVGDYSRHGDLVVDPCCGAGTTGVAARTLGRRFIGIDSNRTHAEIAVRRISEAREQITMPESAPREEHQTTMFAADGGAKGE